LRRARYPTGRGVRVQAHGLRTQRTEQTGQYGDGRAVREVDHQIEPPLRDRGEVGLGEEVLVVALDDACREVQVAGALRACAREVLTCEQSLDRLRLPRRQVTTVLVEEQDVDDLRIER